MTGTQIDYISVFRHLPTPVALLSPDFVAIDVNLAYERVSGRSHDELLGKDILDSFPDNPSEPGISASRNLGESLRRVVATGQPDTMALQRYDVESIDQPGHYTERYWCPVNVPVPGPDGRVACIIHAVEEVPDLIKKFVEAEAAGA
jgi:PAS domain-containing protein